MTETIDTLEQTRSIQESEKFFTLYSEGETFGLSVENAQTIFRVTTITRIPLGPPEMLGLINLRGKIVTAVSLRQRLGRPPAPALENCFAIEIEHRSESFALVVDQVGDVIELAPSMRIPIPPHFDPYRRRLTSDLYRIRNNLIPILNLEMLFEFDR